MSKNKRNKMHHNDAAPPPFELHHAKSSIYHGAARFVEIAPPGIQFRGLTNVDHITSISFSNHVEDVEVPTGETLVETDAGGNTTERPEMRMEKRVTGFDVVVGVAGQQNEFTFSRMEVAIAYYNDLLNMLAAVGVPCAFKQRIVAPPPPEVEESLIVGADGNTLEADNDDDDTSIDDSLIDELEDLIDDDVIEDERPTEH